MTSHVETAYTHAVKVIEIPNGRKAQIKAGTRVIIWDAQSQKLEFESVIYETPASVAIRRIVDLCGSRYAVWIAKDKTQRAVRVA